jgi:hypothetical protein
VIPEKPSKKAGISVRLILFLAAHQSWAADLILRRVLSAT